VESKGQQTKFRQLVLQQICLIQIKLNCLGKKSTMIWYTSLPKIGFGILPSQKYDLVYSTLKNMIWYTLDNKNM